MHTFHNYIVIISFMHQQQPPHSFLLFFFFIHIFLFGWSIQWARTAQYEPQMSPTKIDWIGPARSFLFCFCLRLKVVQEGAPNLKSLLGPFNDHRNKTQKRHLGNLGFEFWSYLLMNTSIIHQSYINHMYCLHNLTSFS